MWYYELNLPKANISSVLTTSYPILLLFIKSKSCEPVCCILNASVSINAPFIKNTKSSFDVADKPVGADAVTAVKLCVALDTKLPVWTKLFRR